MVLVDGEAEDKLTNQHQLKLNLNDPIGQFSFRFTISKYYHSTCARPVASVTVLTRAYRPAVSATVLTRACRPAVRWFRSGSSCRARRAPVAWRTCNRHTRRPPGSLPAPPSNCQGTNTIWAPLQALGCSTLRSWAPRSQGIAAHCLGIYTDCWACSPAL